MIDDHGRIGDIHGSQDDGVAGGGGLHEAGELVYRAHEGLLAVQCDRIEEHPGGDACGVRRAGFDDAVHEGAHLDGFARFPGISFVDVLEGVPLRRIEALARVFELYRHHLVQNRRIDGHHDVRSFQRGACYEGRERDSGVVGGRALVDAVYAGLVVVWGRYRGAGQHQDGYGHDRPERVHRDSGGVDVHPGPAGSRLHLLLVGLHERSQRDDSVEKTG